MEICNDAGEVVFSGDSDAECVRWWMECGRRGDYLRDTGESVAEVAAQIQLGA